MAAAVRFAFAGDRDIAVRVLQSLIEDGFRPQALLLRAGARASHGEALKALCPFLSPQQIVAGKRFRAAQTLTLLRELELDYIVGVHFPYLVPREVLAIPRFGVLNLHPAYLPFNRGWHTPSWAILDGTPVGATLHYMDEGIDSGDIVAQERLEVRPQETADVLYQRIKELEFDVFKRSWPALAARNAPRSAQDPDAGTSHVKDDLLDPKQRRIDLDETLRAGDLIRKLRAHTTSDPTEAAFFEEQGRRYRIRVEIDQES